jgi:hypothetical protein
MFGSLISGKHYRRNRLAVILFRGDFSVGRHGQGAAGLRDSDWAATSNWAVPKKTCLRSGTSQAEREKERIGGWFREDSAAEPDSPLSAEGRRHPTEQLRGQLWRHAAVFGSRRVRRPEAGRATTNVLAFERWNALQGAGDQDAKVESSPVGRRALPVSGIVACCII